MEIRETTSVPYSERVTSKSNGAEVEISIELTSNSLTLKINLKNTVEELKEKIRAGIQVNGNEKITLLYEGQTMEDDRTLESYELTKDSVIYQASEKSTERGNKSFGIKFNKLTNIQLKTFSKDAPDYCFVSDGLNLKGKCADDEKKCKAFDKVIWIKKGMGTFNIPVESCTSVCPICKKTATNIENLGFFNCLYSVDGLQTQPVRKELKQNDIVADNIQFTTFQQTGELGHWVKLDITTKPRII
ncbi:MAG: hypothetical protein H0T62_11190 [Parachlamydiaceae bacterium]|nr:hypothetical protein [Parachlamydiaceae bacterium]